MSRCARCQYDGDLEQHATDTGHSLCYVCERRSLTIHERQTCAHCIARTRADLADIENYCSRLDPYLTESRFPSNSGAERVDNQSDEVPIPGGDAMVLVARGGAGWTAGSRTGNRDHAADELASDPQAPEAVLGAHEEDWRHLLRDTASGPFTVAAAVAYLTRHLDRMAQAYSEFDTFAHDISKLKARLKAAVGLSERPVVGADCFDCGERLIRRYRYPGDDLKPPYDPRQGPGLEDDWTCERCERVYTPAEYWLAVRAALEREQESA